METKTLIGIVVALIVVGGGIWYLSGHPAGTTGGTASGETAEGSGTLAELMKKGGAYKCEVAVKPTQENANTESSGTVYVGGGKMRGDFSTVVAALGGKAVESHMISSEGYVYTWSDLMPQGVKMKVDASGEAPAQQGMDAYTAVDYRCSPWSVEESRFTVPSNVTFTLMGGAE